MDQNPITHVIFDVDGLLLDTEVLYTAATKEILERFGKKDDYSYDLKVAMMGKRALECAQIIVTHYQLPMAPQEWMDEMLLIQERMFGEAKEMPGAAKLIFHLFKHNVPIAVATSSGLRPFELKSKLHQTIFSMFHHIASGSDVATEKGKPAPDIFLRCAKMFGSADIDMSRCLVFEDAPAGVEAARAAGMKVVMVPDRSHVKEEQCQRATLVLNSLRDFAPEAFGLPPYNYSKVTHVIFDMDGLMIDSSRTSMNVMIGMLQELGVDPDEKFLRSLRGTRGVDKVEKISAHFGLSVQQDSFLRDFEERCALQCANVDLLEGIERLVLHLHRWRIPMAVATSSTKSDYDARTKRHQNVFGKMRHVVTGDDARLLNGKPAPDIFLLCLKDFDDDIAPNECLVFEDSNNGVAAAFAAGMQCVHVPETNFVIPRQAAKATQMISSLMHFRPEEFGLPPFDN